MIIHFIKDVKKIFSHEENQLTFVRFSFVRCLDGWGAVESRCVWRSVDVTWLMEGPGEAEEEWWAPSGLLWRQGFRYFMVWGCPWNGVIQESCWKAALWYIQWGLFQKEHLTEIFAWGRAISHPYGSGEKGCSWGFFKKQCRIFSVFELESLRTLASSLWDMWIFLHPSTLQ